MSKKKQSLETRLNNLEARFGPVAEDVKFNKAVADANKKILDDQVLPYIAKFEEEFVGIVGDIDQLRLGYARCKIAEAVKEGFYSLIEYKKGAEERINQRHIKAYRSGAPPKKKKASKKREEDIDKEIESANWRGFKSGTAGGWIFANDAPVLYEEIEENKGTITREDFTYRTSYGDNQTFIQRFPAGAQRGSRGASGSPATPKQLAFLKQLGVLIPEGLTIREASSMIDTALKGKGRKKR